MKKILYSIGVFLLVIICFVIYSEVAYSPLNEDNISDVFGKKVVLKKKCSKDFLGLSLHGELYDFYVYKTEKIEVDSLYPLFNEQDNFTKLSRWKQTPIQSEELKEYSFFLNEGVFNDFPCSKNFINDQLSDVGNYYSYQIVSDLESYFYVYNPIEKELTYLRHKGW